MPGGLRCARQVFAIAHTNRTGGRALGRRRQWRAYPSFACGALANMQGVNVASYGARGPERLAKLA